MILRELGRESMGNSFSGNHSADLVNLESKIDLSLRENNLHLPCGDDFSQTLPLPCGGGQRGWVKLAKK